MVQLIHPAEEPLKHVVLCQEDVIGTSSEDMNTFRFRKSWLVQINKLTCILKLTVWFREEKHVHLRQLC